MKLPPSNRSKTDTDSEILGSNAVLSDQKITQWEKQTQISSEGLFAKGIQIFALGNADRSAADRVKFAGRA